MATPTTQRRLTKARGMTLLEVMLAMFVLTILFGAALSSVVQVGRVVATAKNRTRAVALMNLQMEEMRAMSFAQLTSRLADAGFQSGSVASSVMTGQTAPTFRWARSTQPAAEDVSATVIKVVVTVEWTESNRTSSIRSFSYFSTDGVLTKASI